MKCVTAQQVFSEYVEETIEEPLAVTFERHLEQCDECRRSFGDFRSTWRVLETFPVVEPPSDFRESLLARVKAQQEAAQQEKASRRFGWGNVFGARVPVRAFAWAMIALVFAVLLIKVSPPVFQSNLTTIGGAWTLPAGPGLDVKVRVSDAGRNADVYQIALAAAPKAGQLDVKMCWLGSRKPFCTEELVGGGQAIETVVVQQPQGVTEPVGLMVKWSYGGREYAKIIYLPRSRTASKTPNTHAWSGDVHEALRRIASEYGVAISADAELKGSVRLSGKYEEAKVALNWVADQVNLDVRKEGSCAYRLEPR